jgi:hypothetical protein
MPSFFRTVDLDAAEAAAMPDAIRRMRHEEFDGLLVRGVYSEAACGRLCARLQAGHHALLRSDFPPLMRAHFFGINLNLAPPDLAGYFAAAPGFRAGLRDLFGAEGDLETRVGGLLSALDDGRPYDAAPGPAPAQPHMFTTLRAHLTGGFIPPHFDNEQAFRDSYRFVMPHIGTDLFSFVLAFSRPQAGGELEIFDLRHGGRAFRMADGPDDASHLDLASVASVRFALQPGEMILFNSGRLLHRVTPVIGERTRWTACSFMAESRAGDRVYCWG